MKEENDLEGMKNFIPENAEVPKENIGDLGEQFTKALFKDADIKKNTPPLPDFSIILNENAFNLETTVIGKIYREPSEIFYDTFKGIENKNLASDYIMSVDPYNIRREDEEFFKDGLKRILNVIQNNRFEHQKFPIKAKIRDYTVEFEKKDTDITMRTFGTIDKPASNLINTLGKRNKKKQIEKSDILLLIILNDLVEKENENKGFEVDFVEHGSTIKRNG